MNDMTPEGLDWIEGALRSQLGDDVMRSYIPATLHQKSLNAITVLRAEVERLKNLATREVFKRDEMLGRLNTAEADAAAAQDQLWKLREVLERLIALDDLDANPTGSELADAWLDARAALQGEGR